MDPTQLGADALAALATGAGAPVWAAVIMYIIETLKSIAPGFIDGHERVGAFILAGLLEVLAVLTALQIIPPRVDLSVPGLLLAFLSWFTVARLAMALHDDKEGKPGSIAGSPNATPVGPE